MPFFKHFLEIVSREFFERIKKSFFFVSRKFNREKTYGEHVKKAYRSFDGTKTTSPLKTARITIFSVCLYILKSKNEKF